MKWQSSPSPPYDRPSPNARGAAMRSPSSETGGAPPQPPPPPPNQHHHLAAHPHAAPSQRRPHHESPHHSYHPQHHPAHHVAPPPPMYRHPYGQPRHSPPPSHYDHPHHPPPAHAGGYYDYPSYQQPEHHHRGPPPSSYPSSMPPPPPHTSVNYVGPPSGPPSRQHHYGGGGIEPSAELRASPPRENGSPSSSYATIDPFRTGGCTCKKSRCLKLYCQCFALSTTCGPKCKCQTCNNTTLHADAIDEARKTILERNPSAFDDKFRGQSPSPYRPVYSPPATATTPSWTVTSYATAPAPPTTAIAPVAHPAPPPTMVVVAPRIPTGPPPRVNKYGCKCRRSFCLKKYCECYQNSVYCGLNCRCVNCQNYPKDDGSSHRPPSPPTMGAPVPIQEHVRQLSPVPPMAEASCLLEAESISSPALPPLSLTTKARIVSGECRSELQEDRMAIMAAVAMTELLGTKSPRRVSMDASKNPSVGDKRRINEDSSPPPQPPRSSSSTTYDSPPSLTESPSEEEQHSQPTAHKRIRVTETGIVVSTETSPVRAMPVQEESRNPSPATTTAMTYQSRLPLHHLHPSTGSAYPYPQRQAPPQHYNHYSPPLKHFSYYASPTRGLPPLPLHHAPPRFSPTTTTSCYEDVTKSSGLPKALSFRKICSKCGKTRGEHGELGFGNKCVYQDCGKCGAGVHMHLKAGVPMGILCRLTVDEGAIPGASASYERKISDLATRAELQKTLFHDKRERAARMAQVFP